MANKSWGVRLKEKSWSEIKEFIHQPIKNIITHLRHIQIIPNTCLTLDWSNFHSVIFFSFFVHWFLSYSFAMKCYIRKSFFWSLNLITQNFRCNKKSLSKCKKKSVSTPLPKISLKLSLKCFNAYFASKNLFQNGNITTNDKEWLCFPHQLVAHVPDVEHGVKVVEQKAFLGLDRVWSHITEFRYCLEINRGKKLSVFCCVK